MKKLLLIPILFLVACQGDSIESESKGDYKLELLFEKDGCKMYRFYDSRTIYWCDCSGRTSYNTGGKSPVEVESIITE